MCFFVQVDFGCILNDTEVTRSIVVTNNSPMDVKYHWSFADSELRVERIVHRIGTSIVILSERYNKIRHFEQKARNLSQPSLSPFSTHVFRPAGEKFKI